MPVLANIALPDLKRKQIAKKLFNDCNFYKDSMLYRIINEDVPNSLKSRLPILKLIEELSIFNLEIAWKSRWDAFCPMNHDIAPNPVVK